jgi:hypothetical protein
MRPAFHPSGLDRARAYVDGIVSGYTSAILKGQPVKLVTAGVVEPAASGDAFLGGFDGVEWTDTTGRRRVSNYWPASTAYQTGSCIAYVWDDPLVVYEMQAAGSLTQAAIGDQFDITNETAGSTVTGLSQCTLGTTAAGVGNSKQMRVVNLAPFPGNAWGDAYTVVQVQISEHQYVADRGAI